MRKPVPGDVDTATELEEIISPETQIVARSEIYPFLKTTIENTNPEIIISTLRKGSWIIEDFIRNNPSIKKIKHITTYESDCEDLSGKSILVFDDSIRSGDGIKKTVEKSITTAKSVTVACIAINKRAKNNIKSWGNISILYLKSFDTYKTYDDKGALEVGCQTYYYIHCMMPYISSISVNHSPHYNSLSIKLEGNTANELSQIIDCIINSTDGLILSPDSTHCVDGYIGTVRKAIDIDWNYVIDNIIDCEKDIAKLRISGSAYDGYLEIIVTPMICPRCSDEDICG
jgi:hypothetical protein